MFRIDDATAATSLPAPEAAATEGFFTEGNPTAGTPATKVRGSWLNMIQEELAAILAAAGITRSKATYNQVNTALRLMYSSVVGAARNLQMSVTAASATATLTAEEIIVETALGGQTYRLASFSKTINLATTGAGGMDTGTAPTSGFVALYAIYNPTTQAAALLAANATAAAQPNVYGGVNMPAGYTASALVSVVPTNASKLIAPLYQRDRSVAIIAATALSTLSVVTYSGFPASSVIPLNAVTISGSFSMSNTTASVTLGIALHEGIVNMGSQSANFTSAVATSGGGAPFVKSKIFTPQSIFVTTTTSGAGGGTPTFTVVISSYEI